MDLAESNKIEKPLRTFQRRNAFIAPFPIDQSKSDHKKFIAPLEADSIFIHFAFANLCICCQQRSELPFSTTKKGSHKTGADGLAENL